MSDNDRFLPPDFDEEPLSLETADEPVRGSKKLDLDTTSGGPPLPAGAFQEERKVDRAVTSLPLTRGTVIFCAILLALVGWEAAALVLQRSAAPTDANYRAAAKQIASEKGAIAEPVLVAPAWSEPMARVHLKGLVDLRTATLSDVDRFGRVWLVSTRGATHPWIDAKAHPAKRWTFGPVTLSRYERAPARVNYDFHEELASAKVSVEPGAKACTWARKRFNCSTQRWNWVGSYLAEVGHRPYRCIYAHPVQGSTLRLDYNRVALGGKLVGYTGIDDFENRKKAKGSVMLEVFVGDESVGKIVHQNNAPWPRFEVDTSRFIGRLQRVRFEISAPKSAYRHFCFHAEARR